MTVFSFTIRYAARGALALLLFGSFAARGEATTIVGHRGSSLDAPENTLASFNLAWQQGADAIESDFWLTSDGELVGIHDQTTGRTSNGNLDVTQSTLAQLKALDFGSWKGAQFAGERIPTLSEILGTVPSGKSVYLEIKGGMNVVAPMATVIANSGINAQQVTVFAFDQNVVQAVSNQIPGVNVSWLTNVSGSAASPNPSPATVNSTVAARGANGVALQANGTVLTQSYFNALDDNTVQKTAVWTVDTKSSAQYYNNLGVSAIITNKPDDVRGWITPAGPPTIADAKVYLPLNGNLQNHGSSQSTAVSVQTWGTPSGPAAFSASANGALGTALDFGANARGTAPDGQQTIGNALRLDYTLTDSGSMTFWHRVDGPWYSWDSLLSNSADANQWEMWIDKDGLLRARSPNSTPVSYDLDNLSGPNTWYHVALTWERDGSTVSFTMYVDGDLVGTMSQSWVNPGSTIWFGGAGQTGVQNTFSDGLFDEIRIFDRVLSQQEVVMAMNAVTIPEPASFFMLARGSVMLWVVGRKKGYRH